MCVKRDAALLGRRELLQQVASGLAAALATPAILAIERKEGPAAAKWTLRQSTSSIHYLSLPIEQACERIARAGFEAVDIWSAYDRCPHLDDVQKRLGADGLQEVLQRNRLKLFSFSVYVGGYARYAELLGKVGGGVAVRGSSGPCRPEELTTRMRAFLESLKPDAELAEKHNSYLAIENHGHALLDSLDSFKAFVELNRSPRLGIALAPYHLQAGRASVEEAIRIAGRQLLFFYAWQQAGGMQQLPGHGTTDFTPWLAALAKVEYRWYVNSFMHGHVKPDEMSAALMKSRDYLKDCLAQACGNKE
jgi:sugar phosphate isomerase/epimerase